MMGLNRLLVAAVVTLLSLGLSRVAAAQWDAALVERAVDGLVTATSSVVADTFTPMTHYGAGDWTLTAVPAFSSVQRVSDSPDLEGDNLHAYAGAAGAGYAISDRFMVYGVYAGIALDGAVRGSESFGFTSVDCVMDVKYRLHSFLAGVGFDPVGGGAWSVPLYAGAFIQRFGVEIDFPFENAAAGYSHDARITGEGMLYGVTAAVAVSRNIGCIRVTPYFLFMRSINVPELDAKVRQVLVLPSPVTGTFDISDDLEADPITAYMPGFQVSYLGKGSWSVTLGLGGLISSYAGFINEGLAGGLRVRTIALAFTLRGGNGP
jgi:hypothetical protein